MTTRILLIDDEPKLIEDMLTVYGFEVEVALDGYMGLQTLMMSEKHFDIVILDVKMPKMDGWAVLKAIREGEECPDIPVIMLTCMDDEDLMVSGLRRGADKYLCKPITPKTLLAHIEAMIRRIQWENQAARRSKNGADNSEIQASVDLLTHRETEILRYIIQGLSNQQISEKLVISETTVKNHLAHIYKKLNVANRTQAAFLAQKLKLV